MAITPTPIQPNSGMAGSDPTAALMTQLYDLISGASGTDVSRAEKSAGLADPFASQRPQYQQQLQQLMTDPNSFKTDPGYQFALGQGQEALLRKANAGLGTQRAGSIPIEMAKYTEGYANQAYTDRIQQLMGMAGVGAGSPGTAGIISQGGFDRQDTSLASGAGGLSSLLSLLGMGGGSMSASSPILGMLKGLIGGGGGGSLDSGSGNIDWGSFTGSGDQGGWPGDTSGIDFTGSGGSLDSIIGSGDYGPW